MAGYSSTPLSRKLGLKEGHALALIDAPPGFDVTLGALPFGVATTRDPKGRPGTLDVVVVFSNSAADFRRKFASLAKRLRPSGGLWAAWPKKASGVVTDLTEGVVRSHALECGLVDNKVCAIDDVWSGLRVVYRLVDRPKPARAATKRGTTSGGKHEREAVPARGRTPKARARR
jgi:hypothetical protein